MPTLAEITAYCDQRLKIREIEDFEGACNGLQVENDGSVSHIGAAVDAGLGPFRRAVDAGVDFLICHHGLFWSPPVPLTGAARDKVKAALDGNLAVYGAHLPLDCHPEIGNNALLAKALEIKVTGWFLEHQGSAIAAIGAPPGGGRSGLADRLRRLFPDTFSAIEYGSEQPSGVAILTGSGQSAVTRLRDAGVDTLVTGELRQHHFNLAQELGLNLYPCGHYATETFGVRALAKEIGEKFGLPHSFIEYDCPL